MRLSWLNITTFWIPGGLFSNGPEISIAPGSIGLAADKVESSFVLYLGSILCVSATVHHSLVYAIFHMQPEEMVPHCVLHQLFALQSGVTWYERHIMQVRNDTGTYVCRAPSTGACRTEAPSRSHIYSDSGSVNVLTAPWQSRKAVLAGTLLQFPSVVPCIFVSRLMAATFGGALITVLPVSSQYWQMHKKS